MLNQQQALLIARVALVTAQRDRVVAAYSLLSAIGKLTAKTLGLKVTTYDPASITTRSGTSGSAPARPMAAEATIDASRAAASIIS